VTWNPKAEQRRLFFQAVREFTAWLLVLAIPLVVAVAVVVKVGEYR
jgi:hypothetical protein